MTSGNRGRAKDPAKRDAIIAAACDLFFKFGVEATSIEDVAKLANVSKVTVYGNFKDKSGLFEESIHQYIAKNAPVSPEFADKNEDLPRSLETYGTFILNYLSSPQYLEIERLLIAESERHPDLARNFYEGGISHIHHNLMRLIALGHDRGEVTISDEQNAADTLMGIWLGISIMKLQLGLGKPVTAPENRICIRNGIKIFMRAFGSG